MKYGFGIDLGGTTVKIAYLDETGNMLEKWEIPTVTANGDRGDFPLSQHRAVHIEVCDLDGSAAQINAKSVFHRVSLLFMYDFIPSIIHSLNKKSQPQW